MRFSGAFALNTRGEMARQSGSIISLLPSSHCIIATHIVVSEPLRDLFDVDGDGMLLTIWMRLELESHAVLPTGVLRGSPKCPQRFSSSQIVATVYLIRKILENCPVAVWCDRHRGATSRSARQLDVAAVQKVHERPVAPCLTIITPSSNHSASAKRSTSREQSQRGVYLSVLTRTEIAHISRRVRWFAYRKAHSRWPRHMSMEPRATDILEEQFRGTSTSSMDRWPLQSRKQVTR
jgi:hypothetical protein